MHAAGLCSSGSRSATCMQQCLSHAAPAEAAALHRQPHAHGRSGSGTVAAQGAPADSSSKTTAPFHARQTPDAPGRSGSGRAGRAWGSPGCPHRRCPAARPARSCRCREQGMGSKGEAGARQTFEREWGQAGRDVGAPAAAAAAGAAAHGSRSRGWLQPALPTSQTDRELDSRVSLVGSSGAAMEVTQPLWPSSSPRRVRVLQKKRGKQRAVSGGGGGSGERRRGVRQWLGGSLHRKGVLCALLLAECWDSRRREPSPEHQRGMRPCQAPPPARRLHGRCCAGCCTTGAPPRLPSSRQCCGAPPSVPRGSLGHGCWLLVVGRGRCRRRRRTGADLLCSSAARASKVSHLAI